MTELETLEHIWKTGHFWNPVVRQVRVVEYDDLVDLTLQDDVARAAIASYQDMMQPALDAATESVKGSGHLGQVDGVAGPITELVMNRTPRCDCPDFPDPTAARGSGSWPMPCQKEGVTFSVDKRRMPDDLADRIEGIIDRVVDSYAELGLHLVRVGDDSGGDANIEVEFKPLRGSTIGLAEFNGESCGDSVFCYLDPSYCRNNDADNIAELLCHEIGHNCNLDHTRGGIMNPSVIEGGFDGWKPRDPSHRTLVRYFGGEPIEKPEPDPPKPAPGDWPDVRIDGRLFIPADATAGGDPGGPPDFNV
tara:strand:+ start:1010 stop:1927 length:918 start_codon:yes stop_codon:yes gene_type:complete